MGYRFDDSKWPVLTIEFFGKAKPQDRFEDVLETLGTSRASPSCWLRRS